MSNSLDPTDYSLPGSTVHGILQARVLEWVAMPSSRGSSQPRDRTCVSCLPHWQVGSLPLAPPGKSLYPLDRQGIPYMSFFIAGLLRSLNIIVTLHKKCLLNSEVGCYALLQGIFPTQGLNPGLSHCRQILYHLSHQGSPMAESLWIQNYTVSCVLLSLIGISRCGPLVSMKTVAQEV